MSDIAGIGNKVTEFSTGAVRDIQESKGRCDLMPLYFIGELCTLYNNTFSEKHRKSENELINEIFRNLNTYIYDGDYKLLLDSICNFVTMSLTWCDYVESAKMYNACLDVSFHYKNGLEKYGERNWEKGIPLHSFIDSGTRHFLKYLAHYEDERHDLAFIWNLLCCCHTDKFLYTKQELRDLPFNKKESVCDAMDKKIETDKHTQPKNPNSLGWCNEQYFGG